MEINLKIKQLRKDKKITQDWISYELGITQEAYSKLENGVSNFSFKQVESISKIFNISLSDLVNSNIFLYNKNNINDMNNFHDTGDKIIITDIKDYHKKTLNRNYILNKWKPILQNRLPDKIYDYQILSNYCEKHSYYDSLETNDKQHLLPLCITILSKINYSEGEIEFDEFDEYEKIQQDFIFSFNYKKELSGIQMVIKGENGLIKEICDFIENHIKDNKIFIFQTPLITDVEIIQSNAIENIFTMKTKLNYCLNKKI